MGPEGEGGSSKSSHASDLTARRTWAAVPMAWEAAASGGQSTMMAWEAEKHDRD